jgi:hypothetical protein
MRGKKRQRRVERERAYLACCRPHLQVQTERVVPSPIFIAAMLTVARLRIIRLPDEALTANDEARDRIIKSIVVDHWRENNGRVPAFGGITGYVLISVAGSAVSISGCRSASLAIDPAQCRRSSG